MLRFRVWEAIIDSGNIAVFEPQNTGFTFEQVDGNTEIVDSCSQ